MLEQLSTTPAPSEIGRLAQLLKAAGLTARVQIATPSPPIPGSEAALEDALMEAGDTEPNSRAAQIATTDSNIGSR